MARSKKDIDRELMYKKILPTAMFTESSNKAAPNGMEKALPQNIAAGALEVSIQTPVEVIVSSPSEEGQPQRLPEAMPEAAPQVQVQPEAKTEASPVGNLPFSTQAAAPAEPALVNLMEAFVEKRLDTALKKFKCCTCERCRKDVLAVALNKLPPLYVIEDDPDIRDLHERERAAQVATALVQAILAVKAHPSHEINAKK